MLRVENRVEKPDSVQEIMPEIFDWRHRQKKNGFKGAWAGVDGESSLSVFIKQGEC